MMISILLGKMEEMQTYARHLAQTHSIPGREIARFGGKASSMALGIPPAPWFYRGLQQARNFVTHSTRALDTPISLDPPLKEELLWWLDQAHQWNGQLLKLPERSVWIQMDASQRGWGAHCQRVRMGGPECPKKQSST